MTAEKEIKGLGNDGKGGVDRIVVSVDSERRGKRFWKGEGA